MSVYMCTHPLTHSFPLQSLCSGCFPSWNTLSFPLCSATSFPPFKALHHWYLKPENHKAAVFSFASSSLSVLPLANPMFQSVPPAHSSEDSVRQVFVPTDTVSLLASDEALKPWTGPWLSPGAIPLPGADVAWTPTQSCSSALLLDFTVTRQHRCWRGRKGLWLCFW